jgi:hypothetical protein
VEKGIAFPGITDHAAGRAQRTDGAVITTAMSTVVAAGPGRVWRAITDPKEILRLDDRLEELLEPIASYPRVGQHVRWRYRLGTVRVVLHDRPLEVRPSRRLRSSIALGLLRFDATYTLSAEDGAPGRSRLTFKLVVSDGVPVVGGMLDRFSVRRIAAEFIDTRLRSIQNWCENHP